MHKILFSILKAMQAGRLFQNLNRQKILILAYHGVSTKKYEVPPWIHIPLDAFEKQISYLSRMYTVIPLYEAIKILCDGGSKEKNLAVITFDDGYKNNFTVAKQVLEKYGVPATIFLTSGHINTDEILPLDRAYLLITASKGRKALCSSEIEGNPLFFNTYEELLSSYHKTVKFLKRFPRNKQEDYLNTLENILEINCSQISSTIKEDFLLLSWKEIIALLDTGLFTFGAHTVTHEILTNVSSDEACKQISDSKLIIEKNINKSINLFAYPNGTKNDYNTNHINCLKDNGFICALTTNPQLNTPDTDLYRLGRICIGPDLSADFNHFVLKISGLTTAFKS